MFFGIKDIIDILLVAFILFAIYRILRRSGASNLFWGILAFIFTWLLVSYVFHLELTSALFDRFVSVGAIALIVIFQEEIRSFFYRIGARFNVEHFKERWSKMKQEQNVQRQIDVIANACEHMSASKTGALIVITNQQELKTFADTGEIIDATLSLRLIENIFFQKYSSSRWCTDYPQWTYMVRCLYFTCFQTNRSSKTLWIASSCSIRID
jgi:DNA integrity scanning protein DisA with diadenylate cyclase activity